MGAGGQSYLGCSRHGRRRAGAAGLVGQGGEQNDQKSDPHGPEVLDGPAEIHDRYRVVTLVLAALPGIDSITAEQFVQLRDAALDGGENPPLTMLKEGRRFVEMHLDNRVVDSRDVRSGSGVRRRRECAECGAEIPAARRAALPGVRLCVTCQEARDRTQQDASGYNRRGSKDSQLR